MKKGKSLSQNHPYTRRLIREKVQDWLLDYNFSDPCYIKQGGVKVSLALTRAQVERLTDWITDRIVEGNKDDN